MSPEIIQIVLPLTFLGICGLVGEILVQGRRDRVAEERLQLPASRKEGPHSARKARKSIADARS
ncbi:MAG: hypothetical protein ACLP9L_39775 [Thermoguttaceae bacterium]